MSLGTACGDSVLWCVTVHTCIQTSRNVFVSSSFHCSISLCTACVDSVFCCSGTASSDPCQFFSFHHIISLGTACGDSVFCSVTDFCDSSAAASGDPFVPFDFSLGPVATQYSAVQAPPLATLVISCHRIVSMGTACGHSVFCSVMQCVVCSGTTSGDSSSSPHLSGLRLWRLSFLFCHTYSSEA